MLKIGQVLSPHSISQLNNLFLKAKFVVEGFIVGLHKSPSHGFSIEFSDNYPEPDDIYSLNYNIPFLSSDTLFIHTNAPDSISIDEHDLDMNDIKVVPNPYVATNLMEEAFSNPNQNQERKIMFTHLPARCEIKIFTISGVLVNTIDVNNSYDDGKAYWDLLSNEGLEVAAGMYIYDVQSKINEKFSLGKFAIVK